MVLLIRKYNGGDAFLGYESKTKIIGHGRMNLFLKNETIKILTGMLHIQNMAINMISARKMSDAGVHTLFKKYRCKMVGGVMVLMRRVLFGSLYNMLGRTAIDGCNISIVPKSKNEETKVPDVSRGDTTLWHQRLGHIREKGF